MRLSTERQQIKGRDGARRHAQRWQQRTITGK
jgi:hypothetical protein